MNISLTTVVNPEVDTAKKLYWAEREQSDGDYYADGDYLRDYADAYDWAYTENHGVYGGGIMKSLLESLERDENYAYFTQYTEDEILDEVADSWEGVRDYLFGRDTELCAKITVENMKKALEEGHKEEPERDKRVMSALVGEEIHKAICRGYSQGDYAEVYYLLEGVDADAVDDAERYAEAVFEAYLFGCYSVLELVDDKGDVMARGVVLDYTPSDLLGVKNSLGLCEERAKSEVLREVLGDDAAKTARVGTATAKSYRAYNWTFEEPSDEPTTE